MEILKRKMMDNTGNAVSWTGAYQPFGEMIAGSGNVHGFTGKELDSETGLNYFCQRYYDAQVGRFMTLDPVDQNGGSPYAYCSNNPLKFTDPTGEKFSDIEMEEKYWFMKDYGMWKAGFQDYRFLNYDEWGNLIGIDYYSPNSVNNPYLESFTIPPAAYFWVLYNPPKSSVPEGKTGKPFSYNNMVILMRVLYFCALYGGGIGRECVAAYAGINVFWESLNEKTFGLVSQDRNSIGFNKDLIKTLKLLFVTIVHEGLHIASSSYDEYFESGGEVPVTPEEAAQGMLPTQIFIIRSPAEEGSLRVWRYIGPSIRWF